MLRGLGTVVVFIAFIGVVFWAYNSKRKSGFDEAANLPFADDASTPANSAQESKE